ncbi:unnamed protein product [Phytomonas sp. Hart1]|nr:unnamed protein product [Phytomonas sp. Hart1]|eukprot:CCW68241.1 unnamed protein product [Phytomonas sp. isolate Hart1]
MSDKKRNGIQRSWLDVRCTSIGSPQHETLMKKFLDDFLSEVHSRTDSQFKAYFGDGNALANMLCTVFVRNSKHILTSPLEEAVSIASAPYQNMLVDSLFLLVTCESNHDNSLASLAAIFELFGYYNIISTLLSLHSQLMSSLKHPERRLSDRVSRANLGHMRLVQAVVCCPQPELIRKSLHEATQPKHIDLVVTTLTKCHTTLPSDVNASALAEITSKVFQRQILYSQAMEPINLAIAFLESSIGSVQVDVSSESKSHVAVSLTCFLECVAFASQHVGYKIKETLDFGAIAAMMLALPKALEDSEASLCKRILICFEKIVKLSRKLSESSASVSRERSGIRQILPEIFSKFQEKILGALTVGGGQTVRPSVNCLGVFQCLLTLFICSSSSLLIEHYGEGLFRLLLSGGVDNSLREFVLLSCHENISSLTSQQLRFVLDFLFHLNENDDIYKHIKIIMDDFCTDNILASPCKILLMEFFISCCERMPLAVDLALRSGIISASLRCVLSMLSKCDTELSLFVEKAAVVWKMLVRSPAATCFLELHHTPYLLLNTILESRSRHKYDVAVILRDMFTNLVVKTGTFYSTLITTISQYTEIRPWRPGTSALLAVLVATLQTGKHCEDAIRGNAIELCLAMVCDLHNSDASRVDLHFIGCCLCFLLPVVNYSDVWDVFDSSLVSLAHTTRNVQFMLDLCCGVFCTNESISACFSYFESDDETVFDSMHSSSVFYGPYAVLERPFYELKHPLKILIIWAGEERSAMGDICGDSTASDLVFVVEKFLLSTKIRLPNSFLAQYIIEWKQPKLLCCVQDVASEEFNNLFFGGDDTLDAVDLKTNAWLSAFEIRDGESVENRCNIEFSESSGAYGTVRCVSELWPSVDGYSTETWVHWNYFSALERKDQRNSLWQLSWSTPDTIFSVSFLINPYEECCHYLYEENFNSSSVELPFIPPGRWVHVVTCHSRNMLLTSTLQIYYDGVLVSVSPCPYPHITVQDAASVGSGLHTVVHEVGCTVGSPREKPNANIVLKYISYTLFNYILSSEEAAALYSLGAQNQCNFWGHSNSHEASLRDLYLRDEVLRAINVSQRLGSLASCCKKGSILIASPPERALLRLHARCMHLISSQLNYLNNNQWALLNCESTSSTKFIAYGSHTSPNEATCNEVDALLAHGAMHEWVHWTNIIDREMILQKQKTERVILTARRLLRVLVASNKQTEFSYRNWRHFMRWVTNHVMRHPRLYLTDTESLQALFLISACPMDTHRQFNEGDHTFRRSLIYYTAPLEEIFFNWKILSNLPISALHIILSNIEDLICLENPYHCINAHRICNADFINGFLCSLFRQHVVYVILERAMHCVTLILLALASHDVFLSEALSLCCLSIPDNSVRTHLGSKLLTTSLSYIEIVRNLLLKSINDAWDQLPPAKKETFVKEMCNVLPPFWFPIMISAQSHPVTVTLSVRIFVICFLSCSSFQERYRGNAVLTLMDGLSCYAHQQEMVEIVFMSFLGHISRLNQQQEMHSFSSVLPCGSSELQPLLSLTLNLLKRTSQIFLRDEKVLSPIVWMRDYFTGITSSRLPQSNAKCALRRCVTTIRCCIRLRSKQKNRYQVEEVFRQGVPCAELAMSMKATMCAILECLAENYGQHLYIENALYNSENMTNLVDLVSWPLLCAISRRYVEQDAPSSGCNEKSKSLTSIEEIASPAVPTPDDDDDDWELLGIVTDISPKSYELDNLFPREGFHCVYDACRSFYMSHALNCIRSSDAQIVFRGSTRINKFVLSLHRALSSEIKGIEKHTENLREAFLCSIWLKATENSIATTKPCSSVSKNALALGKYVLDRLVSGSVIAPASVSSLFRFLLTRIERNEDVQKSTRAFLFEWLMYVMNPKYYRYEVSRAADVIDLLYPNKELLFACFIPVAEFVRMILVRLMEISHIFVSSYGTISCPIATRLVSIWYSFINANEGVTTLMKIAVASSSSALLLSEGLNLLLPPVSSVEKFLQWMHDNRIAFGRCLKDVPVKFNFLVSEGGKYNRIMRKTVKANREETSDIIKHVSDLTLDNKTNWLKFTDTTTFVEPIFLNPIRLTFPSSCIIGCRNTQTNEPCLWFWHANNIVGKRNLYEGEDIDNLVGEPLCHYIMYAPPVCVSLLASTQEAPLTRCRLRPNASMLLSKIAGPFPEGGPQWVGNVYFIVGARSHICTLTLTTREVVIISCSEVTKSGDFTISHVRPHHATRKSRFKPNIMQATLRRIMPYQSLGPVTNSEAAFRFSQYYRQVCTESAVDADPFVWRFSLHNVAYLYQRLFQHMLTGLEFIMETGERFFIVTLNEEFSFSKSMCNMLQHAVEDLAPHIVVVTMSGKRSKLAAITKLWVNHGMSNFDYLSALNDAASRTVADVGQYPVMPWVLREYQKDTIQVSDRGIYRDLSKPVGALNILKAEKLRRRYTEWLSESELPFHHGTHYSSAAVVYYYLIRLQPFTVRSISYQGGRLDIADRLFHSVAEAWDSSSGPGTGDVKELIPEFFRVSGFLLNRNNTLLGTRRDGEAVADVILPPWTQGIPAFFVHFNALCLESGYVNEHLNEWIDLIFGYKQCGEEAVNAYNVFHHLSYQKGVEHAIVHAASEEERRSIVASADNFGQTPLQLFSKGPHPKRSNLTEATLTQHNLLANAHTMQLQTFPSVNQIGDKNAPVTKLFEIADTVYGCTQDVTISGLKRAVIFTHLLHMDAIRYSDLRQGRSSATLPLLHSFGCGTFTCMCASESGNLLCVGTSRGKVILFCRDFSAEPYKVTSVMHSSCDVSNPVQFLALFHEGRLITTHEYSTLVTGWHISCLNTMQCFSLNIEPDTAQDFSPVVQVAMDNQRHIYYGARSHGVVIFTDEGVLLAHVVLDEMISIILSKASLPTDIRTSIKSIAYCNCTSFSFENIIYLGLENGLLLLMRVSDIKSLGPTEKALYTIKPHYSFVFKSAITSIMVLNEGRCVVVGLESGLIEQLLYPSFQDPSDSEPFT